MSCFGKPDATGRSSGILTGRAGKLQRPPEGEPWAWLTRELLSSPAWKMRSINLIRLIDFLLIEHQNHAGTENGNLMATYDQLVAYGLTRSQIRPATEEGKFLGLIRFQRGGRWAGTNQPSIYRLTFYADKYGSPATNEWKRKTVKAIEKWKAECKARKAIQRRKKPQSKKQIPSSTLRTTVVPLHELPSRKTARGCE